MRIGTWNLEGRWTPAHQEALASVDCDVWLLTEVNARTHLPGYHRHLTSALMGETKHWAGVVSRHEPTVLADPHPASAAVVVDDLLWCSSVLPWRTASENPWGSGDVTERTSR
ncbi:MAG: hypothetical protein Q4G35_14235, partial [Propionibacteriaceae bacterium]|nr:hypothetical protein [Propionibacteriaceae bacterium]